MSIEVRRNANFTLLAVKAVLKVPIVWMSGDYKWSRAYIMTFLPYKAKGHFNIDLRDVELGFMASLSIENSDNAGKAIKLNLFQMGLSWSDTSFSFDGAPKGLNTVAWPIWNCFRKRVYLFFCPSRDVKSKLTRN